jgi:hypothetical protein
MENSMKVSQKIKNRTTMWSSNPTTGHRSKGNEISVWSITCTPMFIEALFTIAKKCKQLVYQPNKETYRVAYYSVI